MDILNHPFQLGFVMVLGLVGSWFCWVGFREKNVPNTLLGIGLSLPTFGITDWRLWIASALLCGGAWWLRVQIGL